MTEKSLWRKAVCLMTWLSALLACFCGCSQQGDDAPPSPTALPEGSSLSALYLHHEGMAMEPYYLLCTDGQKISLKMTDTSPLEYLQQDIEASPYLQGCGQILEGEKARLHHVDDPSVLRDMEEIIVRYGALNWDGFDRSESKGKVTDSGQRYELYFELSDGSSVTVQSYNCCPTGFPELQQELQSIFHTQMEQSEE